MDVFLINGGRPLSGTVSVHGAKNSALPLLAASLACDGPVRIRNVPALVDVQSMLGLLRQLGVDGGFREAECVDLQVMRRDANTASYDLVRKMRASVTVLGPLLAARGTACVSLPGGCNIGHRPIDLHLRGLAALGADLRIERGYVVASAKRLTGGHVCMRGPRGASVTGTCNVMTAAALARGTTFIESAAQEPEVVDLGNFLNGAGAKITGLGSPVIEIQGVRELGGVEHTVIPDRIEAATLAIAAAAAGGRIELQNVDVSSMEAVLCVLRAVGVTVEAIPGDSDSTARLRITADRRLRSAVIDALPYPGVPTDTQAQLMAMLCTAEGTSVVTDHVFPDRFMHAAELMRMGADIRRQSNTAVIRGVECLSPASVMASDLRASAALVIAGLTAPGETVIRRIYHLDRGYERLEQKLAGLGADVRRMSEQQLAESPKLLPMDAVIPALTQTPPRRAAS